uniref:Uncharacterized protein n=1 Tax=Arundo donax TaxID=35708 RepID=A0A0A8ZD23_ARUDO
MLLKCIICFCARTNEGRNMP